MIDEKLPAFISVILPYTAIGPAYLNFSEDLLRLCIQLAIGIAPRFSIIRDYQL
jgi:hypothetical protein